MLPYYSFSFVPQDYNNFSQPEVYSPYISPVIHPLPTYQNPYTMLYIPQMTPSSPYSDSVPIFEDLDEDITGLDFPNLTERQPNPVLSDNPTQSNIVLFKELTGYPNYGNPSGNADILYTGNRGVWTFEVPAFFFIPGNLRAQIVIRAVLDDHEDVPANRYSARITINGTVVHTGRVPLVHGRPAGQRFNNWRLLTFNVPNLRRNNRVVIENTSNAGRNDWIAFDWMELRLSPR